MSFSLNYFYSSIGISKQAVYKLINRQNDQRKIESQLLYLIYKIRKDHPTMGSRDMYHKIQPESVGRDTFERMCREEGLMSKKIKNYRKTTQSNGVYRFPNLISNLKIERINQVWQSDITYYDVKDKFYYITFIQDSYSKRIIGHSVSRSLMTEYTTMHSLKKAIAIRKRMNIRNVILHSDGGGQYYDKEFLEITRLNSIINSMCEYAWENGMAERLNGVIKNNYLKHRTIHSYEDLKREVDRSVSLYNSDKPHIKLNRKSPIEFENEYLCPKRKTDGDKSATDKTLAERVVVGPSGQKRKTSGSNIALDLKKLSEW